MKLSLQKVLSFVLVLVMVLGIVPFAAFADEVQQASESITSMEGLSISYPYNTETVKQTGSVPSRFNALTFESARNEVESAQMILSPDFDVSSFQLTMGSLKNENGNIIPSWAFEVFVQHYVSISGAGNAPYWTKDSVFGGTYMFKPRGGEAGQGASGMFPDALIPMDAAMAAGENKIAAGKNGGLWVNLDVQDAAPGTYTGFATLTVNGSDMQIPVSVRVYDVEVPEEVHVQSMFPVWWDQLQAAEGIDRNLADAYFEYLVSKRAMPMDAWNITRWDNTFVDYAASYLAVSPEISAYSLNFNKNSDGSIDETALTDLLTAMIDKNIELAQSGSNADLFKKAYFAFYDEPENSSEYAAANAMIAQLDKVKNSLASKLDGYPELKESFMNLKSLITAQHPDDATYDKMWQDVGSTKLTGSYIYCPQFQYLNTEAQRAYYANEESVWWYGCCFPTEPFPTYHINSPLIASRATGWMMYDYDIDGMLYSAVNYWGTYNNDGSITQLSYWTGYTNNGTPGDGMLVYPGSDYGVYGPVGSVRLENIRESFEDYEYLWLLENTFGTDISTYTQGLYEGVIVTGVYDGQTIDPDGDGNTDAVTIHHDNRIAMLSKLEQLNVAANGATEIEPGQEGFVRGNIYDSAVNTTINLDNNQELAAVQFDYKIVSGTTVKLALLPGWSSYYGYYSFTADGIEADGIYVQELDDGYIRVIMELDALTKVVQNPSKIITMLFMNGTGDAQVYIDNIQLLTEMPEIPTEPPVTEPPATEPPATEPPQQVFEGSEFAAGTGITITLDNNEAVNQMTFDYKLTSDGHMHIALLPDWSSFYGYFKLDANGEVGDYAGVTTEKLADGYIRVFIDYAALTTKIGTPSNVTKMIYVRGDYTTANGVVENIRINESAMKPSRGTAVTAGVNQQIDLDATEEIAILSFDYKIVGSGHMQIALLPSWSAYFGYFKLDGNGEVGDYVGVTTEKLEDGYIRVTMDLNELTAMAGTPSKIIDFMYIRGDWSTANGFIDNVQYTLEKDMPRGIALTPGANQSIDLDATEEITSVSFDYKITGGTKFSLALLPNWNSYFGYYGFVASGPEGVYPGVTAETLEDGYIRITMNLAELTYKAGDPSSVIDFLFINGNYSNAEGYIDNVQYTVGCNHSYDGVVTNPDCENGGYTTYTCSKCGDSYTDNVTDALGHSYEAVVTAPTFTANGYTTHTCANCGNSYVTDEVAAYTFSVPQWNIALADDIRANFHVNVDSRLTDAQITVLVDGNGYRYDLSELSTTAEGYYVVSANVAAAQMTDDITIQVVSGENASEAKSYSIRGYAEYILTTSDDENTKLLVQRMLNYGAAAQTYFVYNTGNMANAGYEMTDVPTIPEAPSGSVATGTVDGISYYGASLLYETRIGVRFYFTVTGDINSYTFSNGAKATYKSGMYYVDVLNINPNEYDNTIELSVTNGTDTLTVGYSPLRYISRKYYGSTDSKLVNLVAQMYQYHKAAELFLNENDDEPEITYRGQEIAAGKDLTLNYELGAYDYVSFDYKLLEGTKINVALLSDWNNFYGYFSFGPNGANGNYPGVTTEVLEDGYIHVSIDMKKVTTMIGTPTGEISKLFIRGNWSDASGYIDNLQVAMKEPIYLEQVFAGADFSAGVSQNITFGAGSYDIVTFDYKWESGTKLWLALSENTSLGKFYGLYQFNANGEAEDYQGITSEKLDNGSVRITLNIAELNRTNNAWNTTNAPATVSNIFIRGDWSDAAGTITNIRGLTLCDEEIFDGADFATGVSQNITFGAGDYDIVTFDYKWESGTKLWLALSENTSVTKFYGLYKFDGNGESEDFKGITTEKLDNGYIRVTMNLAELNKTNNGWNTDNAPATVSNIFIRGDWSDATGTIENIRCLTIG